MGSPFPGMDPYLESPALWPDVHAGLIKAAQFLLNRAIGPRYVCGMEERVYVSPDPYPRLTQMRIPDVNVSRTPVAAGVAIAPRSEWPQGDGYMRLDIEESVEPLHEPYLVIRLRGGARVITVIEVLSSANKAAGMEVKREYREKRREYLRSSAHLVEIDLLRDGERPVEIPPHHIARDTYAVYVNRWPHRQHTEVLLWPLPKPLPTIPIPLEDPDPPAKLNLQDALLLAYEWGAYDRRIHYRDMPTPPLTPENAAWAEALLTAAFPPAQPGNRQEPAGRPG